MPSKRPQSPRTHSSTHIPTLVNNMLNSHAQVPQKRERDAASDAEQSGAPAQKATKLGENPDAATNSKSTKQTPNMPKGRAREDSVTVSPSLLSLERFLHLEKTSEDKASPKAGAKGKGKAEATDDDQHDNRTDIATKSGPGPVPWENLSSYKTTGSEDSSRLQERIGDLFAAPDDTVLVHACNTQGSWGAGIAKEFRKRYPEAFRLYEEHCLLTHHPRKNPVSTGTCLVIPPIETKRGARRHWIACLFTSAKYGGNKDSKDTILANTAPAFKHLLVQLNNHARVRSIGPAIQEVRMCQINSGLFSVKWDHTKAVLEAVLASDTGHLKVHVYSLPTAPSKPNTARKGQTTLQSFIRRH
ncbi:hypothetical protein P171DRAFT_425822 [Karstenula rhodostoma CBS 690.94]|uniref:ADP-ribose 1''-phosphate phosphatase n=1 Tax=Karstenula rhodostoma CBS 690.94 TaxID=1392251 RepID=A0A9P4PW04_9PLEO|nr:hypothetical protein P171DRAFT_425822 [Karstenula rhodostoma CBS 690.94]